MNNTRIVGRELLKHGRNFFSLDQIVKATGLERKTVRNILLDFWNSTLLVRVIKSLDYSRHKGPPLHNVRYRVISPKKLEARLAPRLRGENNSSDRMWFIIRKKKIFNRRDLRVLAGVSNETARWFTKMLARAKIIKHSGMGEWALIKDMGHRRPYVGDQLGKGGKYAKKKS